VAWTPAEVNWKRMSQVLGFAVASSFGAGELPCCAAFSALARQRLGRRIEFPMITFPGRPLRFTMT